VLYRIGTSCTNFGVRRPTDGLCARCLDLPYCKVCKRHLENNCFDGGQRNICQVYLQIVLFLHVTIMCIFAYRYKLDYYFYRYTLSRLCATELRKKTYRTTYSTKQRHSRNFVTCDPIRHILRDTYQHTTTHHPGHRSRRFTAARVY